MSATESTTRKPRWIRPVSFGLAVVSYTVGYTILTGAPPGMVGGAKLIALLVVLLLTGAFEALIQSLRKAA